MVATSRIFRFRTGTELARLRASSRVPRLAKLTGLHALQTSRAHATLPENHGWRTKKRANQIKIRVGADWPDCKKRPQFGPSRSCSASAGLCGFARQRYRLAHLASGSNNEITKFPAEGASVTMAKQSQGVAINIART